MKAHDKGAQYAAEGATEQPNPRAFLPAHGAGVGCKTQAAACRSAK